MFCFVSSSSARLKFLKTWNSIHGMRGYFCILLLRVCGLQCLAHMLKDMLYYCSVPSYMVSNYLKQFSCLFFFFFLQSQYSVCGCEECFILLLASWLTALHEQSANHVSLKDRPRCCAKSLTAQSAFQTIPARPYQLC